MISREERPFYEITTGDRVKYVAPEDAAKLIFKKMRGRFWETLTLKKKKKKKVEIGGLKKVVLTETAQSALGSSVTEVVVTVPFEFAPAQKKALR